MDGCKHAETPRPELRGLTAQGTTSFGIRSCIVRGFNDVTGSVDSTKSTAFFSSVICAPVPQHGLF